MDIFQLIRLNDKRSFFNVIDSIEINVENEFGQNLLHESIAIAENEAIVDELIVRGIDVNHKDESGQTPLHYAAVHSEIVIAEKILKNNGDLSIADQYGNKPLWTAVFNAKGTYDIVELFMSYGADPNHKNTHNRSPLDFAKQIKDEILIQIFENEN